MSFRSLTFVFVTPMKVCVSGTGRYCGPKWKRPVAGLTFEEERHARQLREFGTKRSIRVNQGQSGLLRAIKSHQEAIKSHHLEEESDVRIVGQGGREAHNPDHLLR